MSKTIVACSDYSIVTDDYTTPNGRYVTISGYPRQYLADSVKLDLPENLTGKYVSCYPLAGCNLWNLTPISENESGMRDACRVEP